MYVSQIQDIERIVNSFTEQDNEAVYAEVERLDKQIRTHHFTAMLKQYLPDIGSDVIDFATDSIDYQELSSKSVWDGLTLIIRHQRALEIYRNMNAHDEVA